MEKYLVEYKETIIKLVMVTAENEDDATEQLNNEHVILTDQTDFEILKVEKM